MYLPKHINKAKIDRGT